MLYLSKDRYNIFLTKMKNYINKIKLYVVKHKIISLIILVVVLLVGYWGYGKITSTGDIRYITAKVKKGTIVASVSGSGQVSALNQVAVKAKVSGDAIYIAAQDGQKVVRGTLIAKLDDGDAQKSVRDAEIGLQSAQITLEKLKIQNSNENMNVDLLKAYDDGFSAVSDAFLDLPSTITGINNLLADSNLSDNAARTSGDTAMDYRNQAEKLYYQAKNAFEENRINFRKIDRNSSKLEIEVAISETYETTKILTDAIKSVKNFVDYLAEDTGRASDFTSFQTTLSTYTNTISEHLSGLLSVKTSIKDFKDIFLNSDLDLQSSALSVKQKENALQDAKDKLADYFIRAPFDGTLASVDVKKFDSVSSGATVATLITKTQLAEISLNEVDVAKIKIEQKTTLTFDAVPGLTLSGIVSDIDAVGTVSQGVVTYIVKISFDTQDERIKPGMSVSAAIITDMKEGVLVMPNSAIKSQGGISYIENFDTPLAPPIAGVIGSISKITPNKIPVEIGLSNDSQSEIISGIKEEDEIVIRTILGAVAKTTAPSIFGSSTGNKSSAVRVPGR